MSTERAEPGSSSDPQRQAAPPARQGSPQHSSESSWRFVLQTASLLIITVAAYWPATRCGFIWDDETYVENNPTLRSADGLRRIWFEVGATPQYYPLVHTSFWLEYHAWKLNPAGYHVVNILLHAIAAVLFWRVLMLVKLPGAWAAAAVFALHPVHVESVAWITERKNVLSGVLYLGSALAYLHWTLGTHRRSNPRLLFAVSLLLFLFAMLSKTVACTLPAAILLVLWWRKGGVRRVDLLALAPYWFVGIVLGLLTVFLEKTRVGAAGAEWDLSMVDRCLIAGRALWFYVGKLCVPAELVFIYPRWEIDSSALSQYAFPLAAITLVLALWFARGRIGRGPLTATVFFAVALFPALGFFDVYPFRYSFVADHFQYLASLGPIALIVGASWHGLQRAGRGSIAAPSVVTACLLATLGYVTWHRTHVYHDLTTLWEDTLRKNPACWMAHINLGTVYADQDRTDEAIEHLREALRIRPGYADTHYNLGKALGMQGRTDESIQELRLAISADSNLAEAHYLLGNALFLQGDTDGGLRQLRRALEIDPNHGSAHYNLAKILKSRDEDREALPHFRRAVELLPDWADARYDLGVELLASGQTDEAVEQFREAIRIRPDADARNNLGIALQSRGELGAAIEQYRAALAIRPEFADARNNLGTALRSWGRLDEAADQFRRAVDQQSDFALAHYNLAWTLSMLNRVAEADPHFEEAARLSPEWSAPLKSLAWILATHHDPGIRDGRRATSLASRAASLTDHADPDVLDTLAAAQASNGRFEIAVATAEKARSLAADAGAEELVARIDARLDLYRRGEPYVEPERGTASTPR